MAVPGIVAVSRDRVAIDAVAVSILRIHDAGDPIRRTEIFEHEQLKRAAELKLGAASAEQVTLLAADAASRHATLQIRAVLSGVARSEEAVTLWPRWSKINGFSRFPSDSLARNSGKMFAFPGKQERLRRYWYVCEKHFLPVGGRK